ncbi:ShlB/FhaC/HecB family hemolysin secretion/activation protein [Paucibacter sp. R3-3]|uniref:ShlB/FhaC/HecB family hemolysin secretion/activation protein n=1 Tax=Roseateles agri TaxID=3098619 RepID=A0ABU5DGG2_9BURK|nr:ShlB/FhaC/HecB family hemolysin secretion/activation protein [Paucibacter sp. R3-3]MDY0745367.1 ShlB/FhaC/HecB family hemolysin secretion/activation protein [Paucibacter sp. R3-3]
MMLRQWQRRYGRSLAVIGLDLAVSAMCVAPAHAQTRDTEAAEYQRQQARERALREQLAPQPQVHLEAPPSQAAGPLSFPVETPCFPIARVRIEGLPIEAADGWPWLLYGLPQQGWWEAEPRCLGVQSAQRVVDSVQSALIARGYVTSRALVGAQDLSRGVLVVSIIPGRVRRVVLDEEDSGASPALSLRNALPIRAGELLNLRDIEQGLENLKRPPTADADIQIAPGDEPGQSDLHIRWHQSSRVRLNASIDDSGSKSTGKLQGSATISCDNCLGVSDLAYLTVNHDLGSIGDGQQGNPHGSRGLSAYAAVPWGYELFSLSGSRNTYRQSVAGASQTYVYSGTSSQIEATASRLVYRDARQKLTLSAKVFRRHSENFIDDTEVLVQRRTVGGWGASVNHRLNAGEATVDTTLAYRRGTGAFGALPAPEEAFGEGTSRFGVITAELSGGTPFKLAGQAFSYGVNWRWQGNRTPLTPQDRFSIGGRFTVRGFDGEQQLSAEHGWLLRQDLAWQVPEAPWTHAIGLRQIYLALDYGHVGGPTAAQLLGSSLSGAVLGARWQLGSFSADLFAGGPLSRPQGFRTPDFVSGFSLAYSFP